MSLLKRIISITEKSPWYKETQEQYKMGMFQMRVDRFEEEYLRRPSNG
jgi:hypothetical protein